MTIILHNDGNLKVFVINNNIIYRRVINKDQYKIDECGNIILPRFHYCKGCLPNNGYIENLINNVKWEECKLYSTINY